MHDLVTLFTAGILRCVFVDEGTCQIVTRFGKFLKVLYPGLHVFPFLWGLAGSIYKFKITDPITGVVTTTNVLDMKEIVYDYPREHVISFDNVQFQVNAVIYFRVQDPYKAIFQVTDYVSSMRTLVQSILRAEIGRHPLEDTYSNRGAISAALTNEADKATDGWGIKVIRLEIKEFEIGDFAEQLLLQKKQEIERRQRVTQAEGIRQATVKEAEGAKEAQVLRATAKKESALAEAEAIRTEAQAMADAIRMKSEAEVYRYELIAKLLEKDPVMLQFLKLHSAQEVCRNLANGHATKIFVPSDMGALLGLLSSVKDGVSSELDSKNDSQKQGQRQ